MKKEQRDILVGIIRDMVDDTTKELVSETMATLCFDGDNKDILNIEVHNEGLEEYWDYPRGIKVFTFDYIVGEALATYDIEEAKRMITAIRLVLDKYEAEYK